MNFYTLIFNQTINKKLFINLLISFISIILLLIAFINYYIDPMWSFSHKNKFNSIQKGYDERHNKSNYIYNNGLKEFDGLLFGSSRTTHINQSYFENLNIYNYATSSMYLKEFNSYIDFAKTIKKSDFKYLILGLDFYSTNKRKSGYTNNPSFYINQVSNSLYKYKLLVQYTTLEYSIKNMHNFFTSKKKYYDRYNNHNVSNDKSIDIKSFNKNINFLLNGFKNYEWDENYIKNLISIKDKNPNTKIYLFTSPISAILLYNILKDPELYNKYIFWLENLININGEVYHFMNFNKITTNLNNYYDISHYRQNIGNMIAESIIYQNNIFGIKLNKKNFNEFKTKMNEDIRSYKRIYENYYKELN